MLDAYEVLAQESAAIVLCHFQSMNLAIEMGTADVNGKKKKGKPTEDELESLNKLMCCDFHRQKNSLQDQLRRADIASMFVDLMVYDLQSKKGGVSQEDFEDCLEEFMQNEYNVDPDEEQISQIAQTMLQIRVELQTSAVMTQTLESKQVEDLRKLDQKLKLNQGDTQAQIEKMAADNKKKIEEEGI